MTQLNLSDEYTSGQYDAFIPRCRKCERMLDEGEQHPDRLKAVNGYLCRTCEGIAYGSTTY